MPVVSSPSLNVADVCADFLQQARYRHLQITEWAQPGNESSLEEKEFFFSKLPNSTMEKYRGYLDGSLRSKYEAVKGLLNYHSGEVVEVRHGIMGKWSLVRPDRAELAVFPEQFDLHENAEARKRYRPPPLSMYEQLELEAQMKEVARTWPVSDSRGVRSLQPDFAKQQSRLVVPCVGTAEYVWVRSRCVITLGELFAYMHRTYTARAIYYLYLHLDIVSVKRRKPKAGKRTYTGARR